jgi:hypothetical protein
MNWSAYQTAIYEAFENTSDSLLIEAVAGSGKTTVLVELARIMRERMPERRGCFMAFNKSIATTLQERITAVDCPGCGGTGYIGSPWEDEDGFSRRDCCPQCRGARLIKGSGGNVVAMTLHSAGWAAWRQAGGLDWTPSLSEHKVSEIIRKVMTWEERKKFEETTRKLVGFAKGVGLVPRGIHSRHDLLISEQMEYAGLVGDTDAVWEGLIEHYGLDPDECSVPMARKVLAQSIEIARERSDYPDMFYMPIIAGVPFEQYDVVLVDEAQDVSVIAMEMMSRMRKPGGRIIAVGDRNQSIFGFAGAGTDSMDRLRERFDMTHLPLSVSYRCPVAVVQHARQWVPQVEWRDGAPDGVVFGEETDYLGQSDIALGAPIWVPWKLSLDSDPQERWILVLAADDREEHPAGVLYDTEAEAIAASKAEGISKWRGPEDFLAGDAILCRLTRPLVEAAFGLIRRRVACRVLGRDIGAGLIGLVRKPKFDPGRPVSDWEAWQEVWAAQQRERLSQKKQYAAIGNLDDRLTTIFCFIDDLRDRRRRADGLAGEDSTIGGLIASIEEVFRDKGPEGLVTLSTIHKFKGSEARRVFILDASKFMPVPWGRGGGWERQQEDHLAYVAATRAHHELRYITSELLKGGD